MLNQGETKPYQNSAKNATFVSLSAIKSRLYKTFSQVFLTAYNIHGLKTFGVYMKLKQKIDLVLKGLNANLYPSVIKANAECSDELFEFLKENIAEYSANSFETISKLVKLLKLKYPDKDVSILLGCSPVNVWYYSSEENSQTVKDRQSERRAIAKAINPSDTIPALLVKKIKRFSKDYKSSNSVIVKIISDKVIRFYDSYLKGAKVDKVYLSMSVKKIMDNPTCYLTGRTIDLSEKGSYELDHIIPKSRGGGNTIENMGLTCTIANRCKSSLTDQEFITLCKEVAKFHSE